MRLYGQTATISMSTSTADETPQISAFLKMFFFARNMPNRAAVESSFKLRFKASLVVGLTVS